MPLIFNVGIDFDHTLVNKNVNNAIISGFRNKGFPDGTTNSSQAQSAINSADMSEGVKQWLDGVINSNGIDFFNKELLQDLLQNFRDLDCQPFILTASHFPGAAKYMLKNIGETDLANNVYSVPTKGAPQNKANFLRNLEEKSYEKGATSVATVFIDDSTKNIAAVNDLTKEDTTERCIVQVGKKGLDDYAFKVAKDFAYDVVRKDRKAKRESVYANDPLYANDPEAKRESVYANDPEAIEKAMKEAKSKRGTVYVNSYEAIEEAKKEEAIKEAKAKRGTVYVNNPEAIQEAREEAKAKRGTVYVNNDEAIQVAIKEEARKEEEARKMREPIELITTSDDDQTQNSRVSIHRKGNVTYQPSSFEGTLSAVSSKLKLSSPAGGATNWSALGEPQVVAKTQKTPSGNTQNQNVKSKPAIKREPAIKRDRKPVVVRRK